MKKNYILSLFFAVCFLQMNAQTPCSQNNPAPVTSIIYTNPQRGNPIVAFDLVVDANTQFDLTTVTVKMATANGAALSSTGTVNVYGNAVNIPSTLIVSETISPTVVTNDPIGSFAIYTVTFTFSTPVVLDNLLGATDATFWVGFSMGNAVNGDTGVTGGALVAGLPYAVKSDNTGVWTLSTSSPLLDGNYTFEGTCSLSIKDYSLDNSISVYPNPTNDFVNLEVSNSVIIKSVELYNIIGKQVLKTDSVKTLDLSNLESGVYLLKVSTDLGSMTKKIIRN
ncbi:T9SS type A sorting domain-containing protein [Xanthomarina sp.]|uniref:T9SS type A sorting domain-containing protein n=1 Tax=Xanthomarina sp. TaxID=1931211 RepID=UPI002CB3C3DA|nr:T9SS type A sorting domain-containing protein [Xanthomarina sp.]HLV39892.1 T9SS type A sorting domain-containing protein [Xanthomarina sp.]